MVLKLSMQLTHIETYQRKPPHVWAGQYICNNSCHSPAAYPHHEKKNSQSHPTSGPLRNRGSSWPPY